MSNQQQQIKTPENGATGAKPQAPSSSADGRVEIPVAILKFVAPTDVPGNDSTSSCKSGGKANEKRWEIAYLPWMRSFRITFYLAGVPTPHGRPAFVPEARVSIWE